ncbi:hypothetical protein [Winogradskyella haliclonae]|uniref:DUF4890 domain-containing protein n=1 Tax=Winogradskyella haliclonae TaxID=2048558 RepID=A0ABQ2BVD4_9FLAO|nr:hypothetical protein [Winogradskyella haliclonae]GGI55717.1 hypothetical protein GCM10011444_00260 [Winogradskyella haliclonae]
MKKLLVLALALCTFTSYAQEIEKEKMSNAIKKRMIKKGKASPEDRAEIDSKKMTLKLDLSNKQQIEVKNALLAHYKEGKDKMNAARKSGKEMTDEERQKIRAGRLDAQIALKAKMKTILDDEQYAKFSQMMERKMHKGKRRGKRRK